jgi:hypothetical protein
MPRYGSCFRYGALCQLRPSADCPVRLPSPFAGTDDLGNTPACSIKQWRIRFPVRLAAVRHLAYEAADTGLLSPELAAGIARVKGAKRLAVRVGNCLTVEQGKAHLQGSCSETLRGKRDRNSVTL